MLLVAAAGVFLPFDAHAQPLTTLRWQLQPFCNVVTLNVTAQPGGVFTLDGFDDKCGAGQRASIVGTAFLNPDGTVGMGFSTVVAPGGAFVHVDARVTLPSLGGPFRDSAGNAGIFTLTPAGSTGGPPRPVPANGLAPGSVTSVQLAPGNVGAAQVNLQQVQARVTGTCPANHAIVGIGADGSVSCSGTGIRGYELVVGATVQALPGNFFVAGAACPAGKKVLAGGHQSSAGANLVMGASSVADGGQTWFTSGINGGTTTVPVIVVLACANVS